MKIGDKVRTCDPLTACESYINSARVRRRAGALGHIDAVDEDGAFAWIVHADGTRAYYNPEELTVILAAEERAEIRAESTPDYKALAAGWEALARAREELLAVALKPRRERLHVGFAALAKCEAATRALQDLGVTP